MPTDVMLSPVVVIPQDQNTYAKELLVKLSKASEYMAAITKELRHKQKEYYDLGRKTTQFRVGDLVIVRRTQRNGQTGIAAKWPPPMDWPVSHCRKR
jgi:CRISPR/Cas system endoribonuclease Cas6 (RAMP superfamily)